MASFVSTDWTLSEGVFLVAPGVFIPSIIESLMDKTMKKTALIMGVANERSLAFSIAEKLLQQNFHVGVSYAQERFLRKLEALKAYPRFSFAEMCDVQKTSDIENLFRVAEEKLSKIDVLVHSIAFAPTEALDADLTELAKEQFLLAAEVSLFSFIESVAKAKPLLQSGSSIMTLSNIGAQKVIPNYHVMGIMKAGLESAVRYLAYELGPMKVRVNAISAGPVKTLSAMAISNFGTYLKVAEEKSPLRESISGNDVAEMVLFLASDGAKHITGSIHQVDCGTHILGF